MNLSLSQAAELVGKDPRTIRRWKAAGIDVTDSEELLAHSERMDSFARGQALERVISKESRQAADDTSDLSKLLRAADAIDELRLSAYGPANEAKLVECARLLDEVVDEFWDD